MNQVTDRVFNLVLPAYHEPTENRIRLDFTLAQSSDCIQIADSFAVDDSLIDVALGIKSFVSGAQLTGVDPTTIFVRWDDGLVECSKYGGRSSEQFRGVTQIVVCAAPDAAKEIMAKVEGLYKRHRQSKLKLWPPAQPPVGCRPDARQSPALVADDMMPFAADLILRQEHSRVKGTSDLINCSLAQATKDGVGQSPGAHNKQDQ